MNHSQTINELATALCLAQSEMENAKKTSSNPFFKSKYADLAEVLDTVKPALNAHGLSVTQFPVFIQDGFAALETILMHISGQWISNTSAAPLLKHDPQAVGAAISYLRRYSLAAVCGIAQEDDDANSASTSGLDVKKNKEVKSYKDLGIKNPPIVSKETLNKLLGLIVSKQVSEETQQKWLDWAGADSLDKISEEKTLKLINKLEGI